MYTRTSSGESDYWRWRVALGDLHPSGDIQSLHASWWWSGRLISAAAIRTRTSTEATDRMTISLVGQAGSDSGGRAAVSGKRSLTGDPAPWKDPL